MCLVGIFRCEATHGFCQDRKKEKGKTEKGKKERKRTKKQNKEREQ